MVRDKAPAACVALLAAAALRAGAQEAATEVATEAADAPSIGQACLNHPQIRRTKVLDDRNIVFVTRDDTIYNNQLPRECPGLRRNSIVNYAVANSRLCSGGLFQVLWQVGVNNFFPAAVCKLGYFVPITEAELEDLTAMTEENRDRRSNRRSRRETVTTQQVELPPPAEVPATEAPAEETPAEEATLPGPPAAE